MKQISNMTREELSEALRQQEACPKCRADRELAQAEWDQGGSPASLPLLCPHGEPRDGYSVSTLAARAAGAK